jgi:two-component system phosphate regulon response regulator PhoB
VDDEPAVRGFVRYSLSGANFEVIEATSGTEALGMITSSRPDLVLLDIRMPGMDGLDVLRRLRKSPATKFLPVMFLTGTILDVDELVQVLELDPSDFVTKEVSSRELVARVRWVLRRRDVTG